MTDKEQRGQNGSDDPAKLHGEWLRESDGTPYNNGNIP
jgi:hypothetical protein